MPLTAKRVLTILAAALPWLLVTTTAVAHGTVTESSPAHEAATQTPPEHIQLTFSVPIEPRFSLFTLHALGQDESATPADHPEVPTDTPVAGDSNQRVTIPVSGTLSPGWYALVWEILADDGHSERGILRFQVRE